MSPEAPEPLPPERFEELLRLRASAFGLSPDPSWSRLGRYLAELSRWRRSMNLTGALAAAELVEHTLESVLGERLIVHGARLIDIGSGAGFPGLPLAIVRKDLRVDLLEPRGKRAAFLRHVIRELELSSTNVREERVEKVGGQTYDVATVRAVGKQDQWPLSTAILRPRGALIAWTTEARELQEGLGSALLLETRVPVPGSNRREIALYRLQ